MRQALSFSLSQYVNAYPQLCPCLQMLSHPRTRVDSRLPPNTRVPFLVVAAAVIVQKVVEELAKVHKVPTFRTKLNDAPLNNTSWKSWSPSLTFSTSQISSDRSSISVWTETIAAAVARLRFEMMTAGKQHDRSAQQHRISNAELLDGE